MNAAMQTIAGWGGYPRQEARVLRPLSLSACANLLRQAEPVVPRGMGRSYGDSANAPTVLQTTSLDHFLAFDPRTGIITVEAGITLREILRHTMKRGWFLPVTPGTGFATAGGAVASDVHGKNHHGAGTFGKHVVSLTMLLGTGEIVTASPRQLPDLFHATCGGMGLTGVILSVAIQLIPIKSAFIRQKTIKAGCLAEACEGFAAHGGATYSVAWIDCLAKGRQLGRSVLLLGEHADCGGLDYVIDAPREVPIHAPAVLLNRATIGLFNDLYYAKATHDKVALVPLLPYFHPLDAIGGWNKLYGKAGFVQYQFVLPGAEAMANLHAILEKIARSGMGSFLAVLKRFGPGNENLLSFPAEGFTLALDFKMSPSTVEFLRTLDDMVTDMGGRIYLSKDALMRERTFKRAYPRWQEFEAIRCKYGAIGKFASDQSRRLGLA